MASTTETALGSLLVARSGYRDGRPCLRGTGITVHAIAGSYISGLSAEDLCHQNPDLDPSLIHAALAYYLANKERIERDIEQDRLDDAALAARFPDGITRDSLAQD